MIRLRRSSHLDEAKWLDVFHWIFVENGLSIFIYLVKPSVGAMCLHMAETVSWRIFLQGKYCYSVQPVFKQYSLEACLHGKQYILQGKL